MKRRPNATENMPLCSDAAWIADELWRLSAVHGSEAKAKFFRAVIQLVSISQAPTRRKPAPRAAAG